MKKIILSCGALLFACGLMSQEAVLSGGDIHENTTGSVSWSLGEVATETYSNTAGKMTQGQQQPYYDFTSVEEIANDYNIRAYPNPVSDVLNIEIDNFQEGQLMLSMYSVDGKLVLQENMTNSLHRVQVSKYQVNNYIITISNQSGQIIHKFQLTKI